jgi:ankyrin repeat protein
MDPASIVDVRAGSGDTPLHRASIWGCHRAVKALLEVGASASATNKAGKTPAQVICAQPCAPTTHRVEIEADFGL